MNLWTKSWGHIEGPRINVLGPRINEGVRRGMLCPYSHGAFPMTIVTLFRSLSTEPKSYFQSCLYRFLVSHGTFHGIRNTA